MIQNNTKILMSAFLIGAGITRLTIIQKEFKAQVSFTKGLNLQEKVEN